MTSLALAMESIDLCDMGSSLTMTMMRMYMPSVPADGSDES